MIKLQNHLQLFNLKNLRLWLMSDKISLLLGYSCPELRVGTLFPPKTVVGSILIFFQILANFCNHFHVLFISCLWIYFYFLCLNMVFSIRWVVPSTSTSAALVCPFDFLPTLHLSKKLLRPHYCARNSSSYWVYSDKQFMQSPCPDKIYFFDGRKGQ